MWIYLVMVLLIAADQAIKYWARTVLALQMGGQAPLFGKILDLYYAENTGAAFSIFRNGTVFFVIFTTLFLIVLFALLVYLRKRKIALLNAALIMIVSGGIGNLIDRVTHGYVVDMFHFGFFEFPIFNFADSLITIGAVLLFIFVLFYYEKYFPDKKKQKKDGGEETEEEKEEEVADAAYRSLEEEEDLTEETPEIEETQEEETPEEEEEQRDDGV